MMTHAPPIGFTETVTLEDGRQVVMRPIVPQDAPLLQEGFNRLSAQSIYMRFMQAVNSLTDVLAAELATVDYYDRMALVGEITENEAPQLVVVARYSVFAASQPRTAEVAIVIRDDYQGVGLGRESMDRLIRYARDHGDVKAFHSTVHTTNNRIVNFINSSGFASDRNMLEPGVWEYRIQLDRRKTPRNDLLKSS